MLPSTLFQRPSDVHNIQKTFKFFFEKKLFLSHTKIRLAFQIHLFILCIFGWGELYRDKGYRRIFFLWWYHSIIKITCSEMINQKLYFLKPYLFETNVLTAILRSSLTKRNIFTLFEIYYGMIFFYILVVLYFYPYLYALSQMSCAAWHGTSK